MSFHGSAVTLMLFGVQFHVFEIMNRRSAIVREGQQFEQSKVFYCILVPILDIFFRRVIKRKNDS